MSKKLLTLTLAILSISFAFAQKVTVPEPEFSDQTYLLTSNTEYVKLPRETGVVRSKNKSRSFSISDRYRKSQNTHLAARHNIKRSSKTRRRCTLDYKSCQQRNRP